MSPDGAASSALERAVEVMDRLRSPGGCPWDAEQTHESLARYLLEETYETLEAIETADPVLLREELGDLLLQVLFHARLAQELPPDQAFSIEDVAGDLVAKLIRRHPHVFADDGTPTDSVSTSSASVNESWEALKIAEKGRTSALDGVPVAQPALALAGKLVSRARRAELDVPMAASDETSGADSGEASHDIGDRLLAVVGDAVAAGIDPETALRRRARTLAEAIRTAEAGQV